MKLSRVARWLPIPLALIVVAAWPRPQKDIFEDLGPPEPHVYSFPNSRRWKLNGNEETARQRVESLLTRESGWRFVSRSEYKSSPTWKDIFYSYRNDDVDADALLQYAPARQPDNRAVFDVHQATGWDALKRRVARWWRKHKP